MTQPDTTTIVQAEQLIVAEHGVTAETARGLLVWTAIDDGVTVLDVATAICREACVPVLHATG